MTEGSNLPPELGPASPRPVPAAVERTRQALRGVAPAVRRFAGVMRLLALAAAAAGAVVWWGLADRVVTDPGRGVALVIWAVVLAAPPLVLFVVSLAILQLLSIPDRLRAIPGEAGRRADEVRRLAGEAQAARSRGWARSGLSVVRLWRRAAEIRSLVDVAGPVAFVFNLGTLFASLLAIGAALLEVVAGVAMLVWLFAGA